MNKKKRAGDSAYPIQQFRKSVRIDLAKAGAISLGQGN
jgi:hypothetical protein